MLRLSVDVECFSVCQSLFADLQRVKAGCAAGLQRRIPDVREGLHPLDLFTLSEESLDGGGTAQLRLARQGLTAGPEWPTLVVTQMHLGLLLAQFLGHT